MTIAITGLGVISCCGNEVDTLWKNISAGRSGIAPISKFTPTVIQSTQIGEVRNFSLDPIFDLRWHSKTDTHIQYALNATKQAVDQSGLEFDKIDPMRVHTVIGTTGGSYNFIIKNQTRIDNNKPALPNFIPGHINNMSAAYINMHYGIHGSGLGISGACAAGSQALAVGAMLIETGQADVVIAGASDSWLSELTISGFESLGALSYDTILPRPFDKDRSGFAISEGAGILILESIEHANKRNAQILAVLSGYAMSSDAYHPTSPDPTGQTFINTARIALNKAKISADQIDYINAHATGTKIGDEAECVAIQKVFGNKPYISSTKSMTGHSIGSTSAIEAIICVKALEKQQAPGTINLVELDPACPGNHISATAETKLDHIISNSFGFGGTNGMLVLSKKLS
jgi:3-oxoacyl-[acyl-carrier-protein] synthase II